MDDYCGVLMISCGLVLATPTPHFALWVPYSNSICISYNLNIKPRAMAELDYFPQASLKTNQPTVDNRVNGIAFYPLIL